MYRIPSFALLFSFLFGVSLLVGCSLTPPDKKPVVTKPRPPAVKVMITPKLSKAQVRHEGKPVTIERVQDHENRVNEDFAKTSRICPPFCIKPASLGRGVETIGELEVIDYAVKVSKNSKSFILVDARSPEWLKLGTIPGSINVPYSWLNRDKGASDIDLIKSLGKLGVKKNPKGWDFSKAKTVVLFSNGMWSDQSTAAVEGLLKEGYPAKKIKWYRGGMQSWEILGLTVVKPKPKEDVF